MPDTTVIYLTDGSVVPWLAERCRELLVRAAAGLPIVSVSQAPLDFGQNINVGPIGRSGLSMDRQMLAGLERARTRWVAVAEHDCVYSEEHFRWVPPDEEHFFYNDNCWLAQVDNPKYPEWDGMYSYIARRRVQSQLICSREHLIEATRRKIEILGSEPWQAKHPARPIGEPGAADYRKGELATSGRSMRAVWAKLKAYITDYGAKDFSTTIPNLDLRHGANFTGPRRGKRRRFELEPWGRLEEVLHG